MWLHTFMLTKLLLRTSPGTLERHVAARARPPATGRARSSWPRMAAQGATLQNYNNELVKCVDDLKEKREDANKPTSAPAFYR